MAIHVSEQELMSLANTKDRVRLMEWLSENSIYWTTDTKGHIVTLPSLLEKGLAGNEEVVEVV